MHFLEEEVRLFRYLALVWEAGPVNCCELRYPNQGQTFRLTRDWILMYPSLL
jgi:hypothetical protein